MPASDRRDDGGVGDAAGGERQGRGRAEQCDRQAGQLLGEYRRDRTRFGAAQLVAPVDRQALRDLLWREAGAAPSAEPLADLIDRLGVPWMAGVQRARGDRGGRQGVHAAALTFRSQRPARQCGIERPRQPGGRHRRLIFDQHGTGQGARAHGCDSGLVPQPCLDCLRDARRGAQSGMAQAHAAGHGIVHDLCSRQRLRAAASASPGSGSARQFARVSRRHGSEDAFRYRTKGCCRDSSMANGIWLFHTHEDTEYCE
jgi:hypothetical protein